ncbi:MAG: PEP-CTERM sorting domain-containing protein [Pseudomonadota bacterium]
MTILFKNFRWKSSLLGLLCLSSSFQVSAIMLEFDFTYDTRGFFTDATTGAPIIERRNLLQTAATYYAGFTDHLTAITPGSGDSWSVSFVHPSLDGPAVTLQDATISADTVRLYVGGSPSAPGVLGFAGNGFNLTASGSSAFQDSVFERGQVNTQGSNAADFGPWGGYIWFNANNDWHFGETTSGQAAHQPDFLTTAIHEIGHVLGFGEADSWFSQTENGFFTGSAATQSYGSAVPLDPFSAHWAEGTSSDVSGLIQETLMDPSTPLGTRQLLTTLDYAGFSDIGWQVTAVPLPASIWFLFSAITVSIPFWRRQQKRPVACAT